ncbi:N-acetylmuramidase domain-containing protein [Aquabacterium lacunae]|nr:N-acetylmuramidase family protein [Aquabacterium lacunae]
MPDMPTVKKGISPHSDVHLLQAYLASAGHPITANGQFNDATLEALKAFQRSQGLVVDGVAGPKTWTALFACQPQTVAQVASKWLSQADIDRFAQGRQLEPAAVRAVYAVEAAGSGFLGDQPKILFEGHVFWQELAKAGLNPQTLSAAHPDIVYPRWTRSHYVGGLGEHARLARARQIHDSAALRSASWGLFQVMGQNAEWLGYADVHAFVHSMQASEAEQLEAFGRFIDRRRLRGRTLTEWLRAKDWASFAEGYNGPAYKVNKYDQKLARAYQGLVSG